jgi:hypothetical protein
MTEDSKNSKQALSRHVRLDNRYVRSLKSARAVLLAEIEQMSEDIDVRQARVNTGREEIVNLLAESGRLLSGGMDGFHTQVDSYMAGDGGGSDWFNAKVDEYKASESYKKRRAEANLAYGEEGSRVNRDGLPSQSDGKKVRLTEPKSSYGGAADSRSG